MKVIQISVSAHQHQNMCLSEFLPLWFAGKTPGDNPIARGLKFKVPIQFHFTKEDIANFVRKGTIYLNAQKVPHLPFQIRGKSKIWIGLPDEWTKKTSFKLKASDIAYEDQTLIAINKPSGLPSQSTLNIFEDHALSALMSYYMEKNKGVKTPYLNLMHRLDKDTSGLLLFSKKESANKKLTDLFEKRQIQKTYLAVSEKNKELKLHEKFQVKGLINKKPQPNMPFYFAMDDKEGLHSETDFQVLEVRDKNYLLECRPKTGRSHQIRVHLKHAKLPILGDEFYNPTSKAKRLMLHAWKLSFKHPENQTEMTLQAPAPVEFS